MSKNQVGSSTLWGASIDISTDVSVDMSVVTQLTLEQYIGWLCAESLYGSNIHQIMSANILIVILLIAYWPGVEMLPVYLSISGNFRK